MFPFSFPFLWASCLVTWALFPVKEGTDPGMSLFLVLQNAATSLSLACEAFFSHNDVGTKLTSESGGVQETSPLTCRTLSVNYKSFRLEGLPSSLLVCYKVSVLLS